MRWTREEIATICAALQEQVNSDLNEVFVAWDRPDLRFNFLITKHAVERAYDRLNSPDAMKMMVMMGKSIVKNAMCLVMYHRTKFVDKDVASDLRLKYNHLTAPFTFTERSLRLFTWYVSEEEFFGDNIIDVTAPLA